MVFEFFNMLSAFISGNPELVAFLMTIVELVKGVVKPLPWYKGWMMTVFCFVMGFVFAIPVEGFVGIDWLEYAAGGLGLGLFATGIYSLIFETLSRKLKE